MITLAKKWAIPSPDVIHEKRVGMVLRYMSYIYFGIGLFWLFAHNTNTNIMLVTADIIMMSSAALAYYFTQESHTKISSAILFWAMLFVLALLCVYVDIPTKEAPRALHNYLVPAALLCYLMHQYEKNPWLSYGYSVGAMFLFCLFSTVSSFGVTTEYIIPASIKSFEALVNTLVAIFIFCVTIYIMLSDSVLRMKLNSDLLEGLANEQFSMLYQPQVDYQGNVLGAEALIRWHHPQRGTVSPLEFIPFAEKTGFIHHLGKWVTIEVFRQIKEWESHFDQHKMVIAINVSAIQFNQDAFVESLSQLIEQYKINPEHIMIELTETAMLQDIEIVCKKIETLKVQFRVRVALDDFGVGYSSLSVLRKLPITKLKIDKSFVDGILTNAQDAKIASTIIDLAKNLDLDLIAEGVETEEQKRHLFNLGCYCYQGYLFSPPITAQEFEEFVIAKNQTHTPPSPQPLHPIAPLPPQYKPHPAG